MEWKIMRMADLRFIGKFRHRKFAAALALLFGGIALLNGCTPLSDTPGALDSPLAQDDANLSPAGLPLRTLAIGDDTFAVEVAATPQAQQRGLMQRTSLDTNAGMLFIFDYDQQLGFWMLNTLIPLDIAFIDSSGTILNIETMQPETLNFHNSDGLARYALEVNAGEFARRGIKAGDVITYVE